MFTILKELFELCDLLPYLVEPNWLRLRIGWLESLVHFNPIPGEWQDTFVKYWRVSGRGWWWPNVDLLVEDTRAACSVARAGTLFNHCQPEPNQYWTLFRPPLLRKRSYFLPKSLQTLNLKNLKRFTIFSFEVVILSFCISCRFCTNKILKGPFDYLSMFQLRDATKSDEFSEKFQRCGAGGSFSIQKFILQILNLSKGLFLDVFRKKLQYNFPKMGGQMPVFQKFIRFGSVTLP